MRILLFGGTTEGRQLAEALSYAGHAVTVCVATELGAEELAGISGITVRTGRLPAEEIRALLPDFDLCVDATHPYAEHISQTLRDVCEQMSVPLKRICRIESAHSHREAMRSSEGNTDLLLSQLCGSGLLSPGTAAGLPHSLYLPSQQAAAEYLSHTTGNILLTTGAKEISAYRALPPERLFVRILPTHEGLTACEEIGIPHRNIIAMQGPFSEEMNVCLLRRFAIRFLVTKDGGAAGGFPEKLAAAKRLGVNVLVIARPEEEGISVEEFLKELSAGQI